MTLPDINHINKLIGYHLGIPDVQQDQRLQEDLGAESADLANIVASLEEKYSIRVTESEIAMLYTPADIYDLLMKHLNAS